MKKILFKLPIPYIISRYFKYNRYTLKTGNRWWIRQWNPEYIFVYWIFTTMFGGIVMTLKEADSNGMINDNGISKIIIFVLINSVVYYVIYFMLEKWNMEYWDRRDQLIKYNRHKKWNR